MSINLTSPGKEELPSVNVYNEALLQGYTANDSNGNKVTGSMLMRSTVGKNNALYINSSFPNVAVQVNNTNVQTGTNSDGGYRLNLQVPGGYYDGSSYVACDTSTAINALGNRGQYQYGQNFAICGDYVAINNLPSGWYQGNNDGWSPEARIAKSAMTNQLGNANVWDVRSGVTFSSANGVNITGTLNPGVNLKTSGIFTVNYTGSTGNVVYTVPSNRVLVGVRHLAPQTSGHFVWGMWLNAPNYNTITINFPRETGGGCPIEIDYFYYDA